MLLPAVCMAQPPEPPERETDGRRGPPPGFAEVWKRVDKDGDDAISKEEFASMPRIENLPEEKRSKLFGRLDKDDDGKLTRKELDRIGSHDGHHKPMKRLWELDTDKSGGVSFEEFAAGPLFKRFPAEKQQGVFKKLDTDGDGMITPKDRPEPHFKGKDGKRRKKASDENPGEINDKLDTDDDGALSFEEFRKGPAVNHLTEDEQEDRFELLDRNRDGKISQEDFGKSPEPAED